jgi:trans-2,3-dihydro-3-hydroxyanthranilate isomerase
MPTRAHRFVTVDVFTDRPFGGNPLAVFPDARPIPEEYLLPIAREFNYSETTFVYPPADPRHTRRVRIFTPAAELPFAGHPTVGTAHVLAAIGEVPLDGDGTRLLLEEGVGVVPVDVRVEGGAPTFAQLTAAKLPEAGTSPDVATLADVLSLDAADFLGGAYAPTVMSAGIPFLLVALRSRDAVRRSRVRLDAWERTLKGTDASEVMVFALDAEAPDAGAANAGAEPRSAPAVRARVFVPGLSVPEDPATGSACAALGGYLAARTPRDDGTLRWTVAQGVEMGRPSEIHVEVDKSAGAVAAVRVGGRSVLMSEGSLTL